MRLIVILSGGTLKPGKSRFILAVVYSWIKITMRLSKMITSLGCFQNQVVLLVGVLKIIIDGCDIKTDIVTAVWCQLPEIVG